MAKPKKKIARQKTLPTMTDRKIQAIENTALDYAEVRDERMELSKRESDLKDALMKLMHKHGKTEYVRGNISIQLIVEKEKCKVRIKSTSDEQEELDTEEQQEVEDGADVLEDADEEEVGVEG